MLRPILALGTLSLVRTLPEITSCGHSMAFASGFSLAFCKAFRLCFQHTWANVLAISACAERAHDFNRFKVYPDRPETLLFSHKIYSCDCNYLYIIFWLIPLSQLAGPLQTTVSKNPKKPQQRPPAAVAATAASAWRVKLDENGRLYIGNPQYWDACSLSYFEYSLSCFEYNIYIIIYLYIYIFIYLFIII